MLAATSVAGIVPKAMLKCLIESFILVAVRKTLWHIQGVDVQCKPGTAALFSALLSGNGKITFNLLAWLQDSGVAKRIFKDGTGKYEKQEITVFYDIVTNIRWRTGC